MRKSFRKIMILSTAAVMALGALAVTGCEKKFTPLEGDYTSSAPAKSNGGFVVEYGKYLYFVNGMEAYTADNTYGTPIKGALMRVEKDALKANPGEAKSETVIPSLMVSADYTAGLFIYNDRVYFATPNNVKNMSGKVENDYLDFKSAKLDGSDIQSYIRVDDNATVFRFVEVEGTVYLVYHDDNTLYSYNTAKKTETTLAESVSSYLFNSGDKTDEYVYYTMSVRDELDGTTAVTLPYNQIYRVRADATTAPYEYKWDEEYLKDHEGKAPYTNLGEIVLDGIGQQDMANATQFTHGLDGLTAEQKAAMPPVGYTYTLLTYTNDGLYFTRDDLTKPGSTPSAGASLYYLAEAELGKEGWNSIAGNNGKFDLVATPSNTANTTAATVFYKNDAGAHSYVYVKDENIIRAYVGAAGAVEEQVISYDASGATLVSVDTTTDSKYDYVWYTRSSGSGYSVERAVLNGKADDYGALDFEGKDKNCKAVKFLDLQHTGSWYPYEVIDSMLFISDAETVGSNSYGYVAYVPLADKNGKYLTNTDVESINDEYNAIISTDSKVGYIAKIRNDGNTKLANALTYYFKTGERTAFDENIQKAVDAGKKNTHLYTEDEQKAFDDFVKKEGETASMFASGRTRSAFISSVGKVNEADEKAMSEYWSNTYLEHYTAPTVTEDGLKAWEWALIGVAIGVVVIAAVVGAFFFVRARKKTDDGTEDDGFRVDTTDDKDVDVYTQAENVGKAEEEPVKEEPAEEPAKEGAAEEAKPAEATAEEKHEAPAEEPAEAPAEAKEEPAAENAEPAKEEPAVAPNEEGGDNQES